MPSPQLENGYLRLANEIFDALAAYRLPGEQMQCLLFILRKTYGYGKKADMISNSQFREATGMKKQSCNRAINELVRKKIVSKNADTRVPTYQFNKNYETWEASAKRLTVSKKADTVSKNDDRSSAILLPTKDNYTKDNINPPIVPPADTPTPPSPPEKKPAKRFIPPTVDEVAEYCRERGNGIDPEYFVDSYIAKDWMIGKNKMKDWKATVRTWEKNEVNRRARAPTVHQANMMAREQMAKILNEEADNEARRKSCGKDDHLLGN